VRWSEDSFEVAGRGVRLHVRRVVEPSGEPVLLLHGLGVGGAVWQAFARRLLPEFAAIAPDLRGHGQSDAPHDGYQPLDYATDIAALLSAEARPVPIVGHSLGALVALEAAALEPARVPWIVLLDPPLDSGNRNGEIADVYRLRHGGPDELEAYLLGRNPGGGALLASILAGLFRQAADRAFEVMLDRDTVDIPCVAQPTLILQADPSRGGVLGDEAARRAIERLPHAELQKFEAAPHALHASHPAEVAAAIKAFAASTQRGR
jgi:pimeloyl-ACP methyl ester carboxylesterase